MSAAAPLLYSQVTIKVQTRGEAREVWFVLESKHRDLSDLFRSIREVGAIYGTRLETRPDGDRRRVHDSYETILMKDSIVSISEMQTELVDEDGTPLWTFPADAPAAAAAL